MNDISVRQQAWLRLAATIGEGISLPNAWLTGDRNMSGRTPVVSPTGHVAFAAGLSATGLRAAAWLAEDDLPSNANALRQAVRNLQPIVVIAGPQQAKPLAETGAFMLRATNFQELLDFSIIAHRAAEKALVPGVIIFHEEDDTEHGHVPAARDLHEFLGDADDAIESPTPAQSMIFGKTRRRIPRLFHPDLPVLAGAAKTDRGIAYENAARQAFLSAHVNECLTEAFTAFAAAFGRRYEPYIQRGSDRAELFVFCDSTHVFELSLGLKGKHAAAQVLLKQLLPFPPALADKTSQARAIAAIEPSTATGTLVHSILLHAFAHRPIPVYSGLFAGYPAVELVQEFIYRIEANQISGSATWLDIPFATERSEYPKKKVLMQDVLRQYPKLAEPLASKRKQAGPAPVLPTHIPMNLRRHRDQGPVYARLAHFFDTTAFFYEQEGGEWTADPFQAIPVMPPDSAGFGRATADRKHVPVIDLQACSGCGQCMLHCPHAALPSIALDLEAFIKSGIQQAQAAGHIIAQLHPQVKGLAKAGTTRINSLRKGEETITIGHVLTGAIEDLLAQQNPDDTKREALMREVGQVIDAVGSFQVNAPDALYNDKGKSLFSLSVDLNACTGCGICSAVCPDEAISMQTETPDLRHSIESQFETWERLPDTSGDILQRLLDDPAYPSIAALLLSRNFYMSLTGATDTHAPAAKTMIHLAAAVTETLSQKGMGAMVKRIEELTGQVSASVRNALASALPDVLDAGMADKLNRVATERLSIDELLGGVTRGKLLDKAGLQRKLELVRQLNDLRELLVTGAGGTGRARFGLVLDASLAELAAFPDNSFSVPVMHFDGASGEMARGLVQGHLRHFIDNVKVLRRAELEAQNQYSPVIHDMAIAGIDWSDLTDEERAYAPPVLVVGRQSLQTRQGPDALARLLEDHLPVKVLVLDNANPAIQTGRADLLQDITVLLPLVALGDIQILQGSLARPEHLFEGLVSAMGKPGGAFIRLLAPDGTSGNLQLMHELATDTRAFLHFDYRPDRHTSLRLPRLHIDANPDPDRDWVTRTLVTGSENGQGEIAYEMTFADWLYTQPDRKAFFMPYVETLGEGVPMADYLRLDPKGLKGKVPVILRIDPQGKWIRYAAASAVVEETRSAHSAWNLLRELAGELAEYPEKLYARATKEAADKFTKEKNDLVAAQEQRIRQLEQEYLETIRARIKARLMGLSGSN